MNRSLRLLILFALIVVVAGLAFVFLSSEEEPAATTTTNGGGNAVAQATTPPQPSATPEPTTQLTFLVIAVQPISRGALIPPNAVELREWPLLAAPFNALTSIEDVVGKRARTDIFVEQPILNSMVVDDLADLASVGSDVSAIIPRGRVGISVPMDRLTSVAFGIQPGDRVDIIVSFLFVDLDEEFQSELPNNQTLVTIDENNLLTPGQPFNGRIITLRLNVTDPLTNSTRATDYTAFEEPTEDPRPRLLTQRTIQDALVLHVGNFPLDGRLFGEVATPTIEVEESPVPVGAQASNELPTPLPTAVPAPDIVTLAVTPQEAVILTYLIEARIPVTFALRSASDTSQVPTESVTLDYIMAQYGITVPEKREFSIEPAIRSIRQLVAAETIELNPAAGGPGN